MPVKPQRFEFSAEEIAEANRRSTLQAQARLSRQDPQGEFKPLISGNLTMDLWDINSLQFRPKPRWLIHNMVEEKGLTIFFGPDKVGKTALLSNFLWAWCGNKPYFLHKDYKMEDPSEGERKVVYVLLEGQAAYYDRYRAWCDAYNEGDPIENFVVADDGLSLFDKGMRWDDVTSWTDSAVRLYNALEEFRPDILVVDTLSRATAGMDENSPQMAQVVGWLDYVRDTLGAASIIVHHVALADGDRPRGHSSLKGAASSYVRITGEPADTVLYLHHGPHRNAESGESGRGFVRRNYKNSFITESTLQNNKAFREPEGREKEVLEYVKANGESTTSDLAEAIYGETNSDNRKKIKKVAMRSDRLQLLPASKPGQASCVAEISPDFPDARE